MSQPYSDTKQPSNITSISANDMTKRSYPEPRTPDMIPYSPYPYPYYPMYPPPYGMPQYPPYHQYPMPHYPPPHSPHMNLGTNKHSLTLDRRSNDLSHQNSGMFYQSPYMPYPPSTPHHSTPHHSHMPSNTFPYQPSMSQITEDRGNIAPYQERPKEEFYSSGFLQIGGDKAEKLMDLPNIKLSKEISFNPLQQEDLFKNSNYSSIKFLTL